MERKLTSIGAMLQDERRKPHIDTPAHFIHSGKTLEDYHPCRFILPAVVIEATDREAITPDLVEGLEIRPGDAVLFKTDNSKSGKCRSGVFAEDYVYISEADARALVRKSPAFVGLDYISIEKFGDAAFPAHHILLGSDVLVLEGIDLGDVPAGKYVLVCFPLKMKGAEASPVRAVLFPLEDGHGY